MASKGINKAICEFELYLQGSSIPEVNEKTGIPLSTLRFRFHKAGILRSRADGVRSAYEKGRIPSTKGTTRAFTQEWKENLSKSKQEIGKLESAGIDTSKSYPRFTRGKHKGRFVHQVVMELWLGRELVDDEIVHHIDENKQNNDINNLALLTTSGHARLHRFQDKIAGKRRNRNSKGEFL